MLISSPCVCLGEFTTHLTNVSIYRNKGPLTNLGTKLLIKIIGTRNHMIHHFEGSFSIGALEIAIPRLMPHAKKRNLAQVVALEIYAPQDQVAYAPANDSAAKKHFKKKRKNKARKTLYPDQPDAPPTTKTSCGMFFLADPSVPVRKIFSEELSIKPYVSFVCSGKDMW